MPGWKNSHPVCEHQPRVVASFTSSSEWYIKRSDNQLSCLLWNIKRKLREAIENRRLEKPTEGISQCFAADKHNSNGQCGKYSPRFWFFTRWFSWIRAHEKRAGEDPIRRRSERWLARRSSRKLSNCVHFLIKKKKKQIVQKTEVLFHLWPDAIYLIIDPRMYFFLRG